MASLRNYYVIGSRRALCTRRRKPGSHGADELPDLGESPGGVRVNSPRGKRWCVTGAGGSDTNAWGGSGSGSPASNGREVYDRHGGQLANRAAITLTLRITQRGPTFGEASRWCIVKVLRYNACYTAEQGYRGTHATQRYASS